MGCHAINWSPNRVKATTSKPCTCGLSAVRDAIAQGHRVVIGPDGVEGRLVADDGWECFIAGDGDPALRVRDDLYRLVPIEEATDE